MKRVLIFLIFCFFGIEACFADCNALILPSCYLKKNDSCVLYRKNLEEELANDLIKNFFGVKKFSAPTLQSLKRTLSSNPQLNSELGEEARIKLLAKIYGANKVVNIFIRYEVKSANVNQNSKVHEKMALISDNTFLRIITKVNLVDSDDGKIVWSNVYCKNINFENIDSKNLVSIFNYFEKLSKLIVDEIKDKSNIRSNNVKQQSDNVDILEKNNELKRETVEIHHVTPNLEQVNSNIKPQLNLQEDLFNPSKTKQSGKNIKPSSLIKNVRLKLKHSAPEQEIKMEDIKLKSPVVQPAYTNIHVTPRKNSRDYTPKFNSSVNDI